MKIHQEFEIARPVAAVWSFFHDIPRVAACLPGAEYLGPSPEGRHLGKVTAKVGPFQTHFEGEATVGYDDTTRTIVMEGKGVDKKGGSRGKMSMSCAVTPAADGAHMSVDTDVQLAGAIAQFGRTGLITEIANLLVADFVRNAEAAIAATAPVAAPAPASAEPLAASDIVAADMVAPAISAAPSNAAALPPRQPAPIPATSILLAAVKAWLRSLFRRRT